MDRNGSKAREHLGPPEKLAQLLDGHLEAERLQAQLQIVGDEDHLAVDELVCDTFSPACWSSLARLSAVWPVAGSDSISRLAE
ncbi:hypothetical protein TYRP_021113 [Tyrophagus putrescentiae]|nr:hypothetical protein TYRP_021113 [Tyrophagus putrescentiae]